jgi:hypothetical protein
MNIIFKLQASPPMFIGLSEDLRFHVLLGEKSLGCHSSFGAAMRAAADRLVPTHSNEMPSWGYPHSHQKDSLEDRVRTYLRSTENKYAE